MQNRKILWLNHWKLEKNWNPDIKWLKTLETETHKHSWWIPDIFQCLNQKIVIWGKVKNINKYANKIIWITEIQIEGSP
jgi:hypothetical protein